MTNPLEPYLPQPAQPRLMTGMERLLAPKPAPSGDLRPWDSKVAQAGAYLEDTAGMPNLGKVVQAAGLGSIEGIRPDQLVRAGTDVAMLAPQVGTTVRSVNVAARTLPALYQGIKQGVQAALPAVIKAAPVLANAGIETTYLTSALTGNQEMADLANMARAGQRGLRNVTARRDLDIGRQGVQDKNLFGQERDQLAAAMRLARQGQDMEAIRQQTGWRTLPGREGTKPQWAYEIADNQTKIKNSDGLLSEQLTHPRLYDHYPDAAFIERKANANLGEARGKLNLNGGGYGFGSMEYNPLHPAMATERNQRGNALHELQHWIQKREGWEGGGNPMMTPVQDAANTKMEELFASGHLNSNMPVSDLMKTQNNLARESYWNLAGEAQARSAANRMDLTHEQRRAISPYQMGYDRNRDELIYLN